MNASAKQWASGWWLRLTRRAEQNRRKLYAGRTGLRIVLLHNVYPHEHRSFLRIIERCREAFEPGTPEDVDALLAGRFMPSARDKILFTFDDGCDNNYQAAGILADRGWRALFFIVPPFLNRTTDEFVAFHAAQGVDAFPLGRRAAIQPSRGMTLSQVRELPAMGHRVGAHNYAHRSLGELRSAEDLEYEIGRSLDEVSELTGSPCEDFAVGFGHWSHLSSGAVAYLQQRCPRVYLACRGLNVAERTSRFLCRTQLAPNFPWSFTQASLAGALDHRERREVEQALSAVGRLPQGVDS